MNDAAAARRRRLAVVAAGALLALAVAAIGIVPLPGWAAVLLGACVLVLVAIAAGAHDAGSGVAGGAAGVVEHAPELLFRTDERGVVEYVNPRWSQLTGHASADAVGRPLHELVDAADAGAVRLLYAGAGGPADAPRRARAGLTGSDGRRQRFEFTLVALPGGAGPRGFAGSAVDITHLTDAQAELGAHLAFIEALLEVSPLPIAVLDPQGCYLRVNKAWEAYAGRPRDAAIGQRAAVLAPSGEGRPLKADEFRRLAAGDVVRFESRDRKADGSPRDLFVTLAAVPGAGGRPPGVVGAIMDISEFREAERVTRRARDAAEQASHAKTEFVANISHELRTPLQSILGFSELGKVRGREHERLAAMFADIHAAGQRMLALVNDLLDLSKLERSLGHLELERSDIRESVASVVHEFEPLLAPRGLRVALSQSAAPVVAQIHAPRFEQVVRNVLANAVRFSPDRGVVDVTCDVGSAAEVFVRVADRGPGIPEGELETIFEAFVQSSKTKDGSGGTGLGLAISRQIIRAHGGRLNAAHREGGGSVFEIALPAAHFGDTTPAAL